MKKTPSVFLILLLLFACIFLSYTGVQAKAAPTLCILPGLHADSVFGEDNRLPAKDPFAGYHIVIIDAESYQPEQIQELHDRGHLVYSYLNIGSLETFRSDYEDYKDLRLDRYENWPNEYWIDVTDGRWQDRCSARGNDLIAKGVDGFFIDNTDVYSHYKTKRVKHCLDAILKRLRKKTTLAGSNPQIILNGGSTYVTAKLEEKKEDRSFTGICQESVYDRVTDYDHEVFKHQTASSKKYYLSYLKKCKKAGLSVTVLDYVKSRSRMNAIRKACKKLGYSCYLSTSLALNKITPVK
ncbi:MAG: endo alpha-1,4 polygalactosaminidase [Lachnospiraceae bacterium]|nr:endo alpha-1,4 polygalactosaminidase [Lachnospiraceae bacterium]